MINVIECHSMQMNQITCGKSVCFGHAIPICVGLEGSSFDERLQSCNKRGFQCKKNYLNSESIRQSNFHILLMKQSVLKKHNRNSISRLRVLIHIENTKIIVLLTPNTTSVHYWQVIYAICSAFSV